MPRLSGFRPKELLGISPSWENINKTQETVRLAPKLNQFHSHRILENCGDAKMGLEGKGRQSEMQVK